MSNIPTGMGAGTGMYYNKVQAEMQQYLNGGGGGNRNRSRAAPRGAHPGTGSSGSMSSSAQRGQNAGIFARRFVHNFFSRS